MPEISSAIILNDIITCHSINSSAVRIAFDGDKPSNGATLLLSGRSARYATDKWQLKIFKAKVVVAVKARLAPLNELDEQFVIAHKVL